MNKPFPKRYRILTKIAMDGYTTYEVEYKYYLRHLNSILFYENKPMLFLFPVYILFWIGTMASHILIWQKFLKSKPDEKRSQNVYPQIIGAKINKSEIFTTENIEECHSAIKHDKYLYRIALAEYNSAVKLKNDSKIVVIKKTEV